MSECKGCGARIIFIKTQHGRTIPVNFEEWIDPRFMYFDAKKMTTHFATCPKAEHFRREYSIHNRRMKK